MPRYLIERTVPGAGKLNETELREIAQKSCDVLSTMGPAIQWQHSYITDDKITCIYHAESEDSLREHALKAGFPIDRISKVAAIIDSVTAEEVA